MGAHISQIKKNEEENGQDMVRSWQRGGERERESESARVRARERERERARARMGVVRAHERGGGGGDLLIEMRCRISSLVHE